eukprot:scaffold14465_cov107-Isochrysis_galbana.AAC.3
MALRRLARYFAARLGRAAGPYSAPDDGYAAVAALGARPADGEDGGLTHSMRSRVEELTRMWLWCSCIAWSVVCLGATALVTMLGAMLLTQRHCSGAAPAESLLLGWQLCRPADNEMIRLLELHSRRSQVLGPGARGPVPQPHHAAATGGGDGGARPARGPSTLRVPSRGGGPQLVR